MKIPKYLQNKVKEIDDLEGYKHRVWFQNNDLKLKLSIDEIEHFKISFHGKQIGEFIVNEEAKPLVIFAEEPNGTKHTLFDGRFLGFEALLIEDFSKIKFDNELYYSPNEDFEIYLWFNYSIDLDDEYPNDKIELTNGEKRKKENIRDLLFDSFGIILKNAEGIFTNVVEMELD